MNPLETHLIKHIDKTIYYKIINDLIDSDDITYQCFEKFIITINEFLNFDLFIKIKLNESENAKNKLMCSLLLNIHDTKVNFDDIQIDECDFDKDIYEEEYIKERSSKNKSKKSSRTNEINIIDKNNKSKNLSNHKNNILDVFKTCIIHGNELVATILYKKIKEQNSEFKLIEPLITERSIIGNLILNNNIVGIELINKLEHFTQNNLDEMFVFYIESVFLHYNEDKCKNFNDNNILDFLDKHQNHSFYKINSHYYQICIKSKFDSLIEYFYVRYSHKIDKYSPLLFDSINYHKILVDKLFDSPNYQMITNLLVYISNMYFRTNNEKKIDEKKSACRQRYRKCESDFPKYEHEKYIIEILTQLFKNYVLDASVAKIIFNNLFQLPSHAKTTIKTSTSIAQLMSDKYPEIVNQHVITSCINIIKSASEKTYTKQNNKYLSWVFSIKLFLDEILLNLFEINSDEKNICQLCMHYTKYCYKKCKHYLCNECFVTQYEVILKNKLCTICKCYKSKCKKPKYDSDEDSQNNITDSENSDFADY